MSLCVCAFAGTSKEPRRTLSAVAAFPAVADRRPLAFPGTGDLGAPWGPTGRSRGREKRGGGSSCAQRGGSLFELRSLPCASAYLSPRPLSGIPVLKGEPLNADALSAKLALFQHLVWGDAHFNAVP